MRSLRKLIPAALVASSVVAFAACSSNSPDDPKGAGLQAAVTPSVVPGFPSCQSLGYATGCFIDVEATASCSIPQTGINVTISPFFTGFDWSATGTIDAVVVFGGGGSGNSHLYVYPGGSTGDTGLISADENLQLFNLYFCAGGDAGVDAGPDAPPDAPPDAQTDAPTDVKNDRGQPAW